MQARLLIATDGSELAGRGLAHGLTLAAALKAPVTILTVTERYPILVAMDDFGASVSADSMALYNDTQATAAAAVLASARAEAEKLGVVAETLHMPDSYPAEAILKVARDRNCTMIVMASHGRRGLGRLLVGSQTAEVLNHATVPVLVVR